MATDKLSGVAYDKDLFTQIRGLQDASEIALLNEHPKSGEYEDRKALHASAI